MAGEAKDYVKDIERKDNLKQELRETIDDENFVKKLDQDVEQSFQQFTESIKNSLTGNETREELQDRFNGWLDRQMNTIDSFKDNEIAKAIIGPTTFELQKFSTATELGIFQSQLNQQKDATQQTEIVSVNGSQLKIDTYKDDTGEKVNKDRIAELFNKNFERKDDLLNLLKQGGINNVKKFQRIIIGVSENDTSRDGDKTTLLGTFGVDGRFGGNTMKAFEDYIAHNERVSTPTVDNTQTVTDAPTGDDVVQATVDVRGQAVQAPVTGSPAVRSEVAPQTPTEIEVYEHEINSLPEIDEAKAREIVQKETEAGKTVINLHGLKKLSKEVATILAGFEGELYLNGLESVNKDVLNAFKNGKCKLVQFSGGTLSREGDKIVINLKNGSTYEDITDEVCSLLINNPGNGAMTGAGAGGATQQQTGNGAMTGAGAGGAAQQQAGGATQQQAGGNQQGNNHSDVQQQYEGIGYNIDDPEATRQASSDEEAIQFLTRGSGRGVFFIARLFGKKKHNAELSIVDADYKPTGQEKTDLNNLNKYLLECKDNPTEVFSKIFRQNRDFGDNEKLGKLYDLYRECRNDQNGTNKGAYLKKVMGLLENYFVRGIKGKDGKIITTFKDMYNNELIGIKKDLEDRERRAKKSLDDSEQSQLEEAGGTALEAANTKTQLALPSENFAEFREKYGFSSNAETQFAMCLCDLNADGRIDSRDMNAKTGQELFNIIRDAKVDHNSGILEKGPMYNILNFAKVKAEQDGHTNTAEFLKGIDLTKSDEEIMNKLKERPLTMQYIRYMLINSPMNMANNIIRYGGVRVETENTGDDLNLDKETREAINKIMSDEKFEEIYGNAYQQLIEQGLNDTPEIKKKLRPIIALALFESSGSYMGGISGGFDLSLGNAGDIAFMLGVGYGPDGNIMAGVNVAYGKSRALGKRKGSIISVGVSGGVNFAEGQFVPMVIGSAGFSQMINGPKLEKTLEARSAKFLGVDGNVGVIGGIPVWGVGLSYSQDTMKGLNTTYESIKSDLGNVLKETLKDSWPNSTDKTEIRTQMIASIKTALESRYGRTNEDELNKAAQNIFGGISYYLTEIENPSQITQEQKTAIIEKVAENYANQRRNKEMQNLNGKTTFESARVGLEFLVGYWPIPMASVSFKTYGNLTANETQESMENYYQRLSSGIGMEYIDNSVSTEGPDKGYLTAASITYLNNKLSVLSPSGNVPPIKKIINGDKYDLQIPRDLCKYANISYNPELENYMRFDESSNSFLVPANIKMGLLTYSRTNDGKYNLILGDFKKGDGFKDLDINSKPEGDTSKYEGKEGELKITETAINTNEEMKELFENPNFPLSECVDSKDGKVYFKTKEGFNIAASRSGKVGFPQKGILSAPEYGKLQITKTEGGIYMASFDDSVKDKLTIEYVDEKKAREYIENSQRELGLDNSFDQYNQINDMFNNIETRLSRLDDGQWGNYADFMDYASSMIDGVLDESDYSKAFDKLKDMLSKLNSNDLKDTNLSALKQKIDTGDLSNTEKVLIVDRFKMLFSYHINLTDGQKDYDNLVGAIKGRGNVYERLTGYSGAAFPLAGQGYREKILNQLKDQTNLSREVWPSLIGMTAFYRYNTNGRRITEGRGYSMTEMGRTSILGGAYEELTDDASKNRFISNLEKSEAHKTILSEVITKKIQSISGLENITIYNDQIVKLLRGEELDISGKKFTIEMKYMFYLLGECGNESIGLNLEKIIIKGAGGGGGGETGVTTVEIAPETSYKDAAGLSIDGVAAENRLNLGTSRSRTYGIAVGNKKAEQEPQDDPRSDPNGNDDNDNPRSDPNGGDGDNPGSSPGNGDNGGDDGPVGGDNDGLD